MAPGYCSAYNAARPRPIGLCHRLPWRRDGLTLPRLFSCFTSPQEDTGKYGSIRDRLVKRFPNEVSAIATNDCNVRFGSKADMCTAPAHVRFTPESGHVQRTS